MTKKMLINAAEPEESRVAIVSDGVLEEIGIETSSRGQIKGNIYKGVVGRVEPGIQAAFVNFGERRDGFIPLGEVNFSLFQKNDDGDHHRRRGIHDFLKKGQEVLVQVVKEEREWKGAFLTTFVSLAGRYLVLMPGSDGGGVSRKIESDEQRKKLKEIIAQLDPPEGMGIIVRTAGMGRHKIELSRDLAYLLKLWESIQQTAAAVKAPALVFKEQDLVTRSIRDYFTPDIKEVLVDTKDAYHQAREFFKSIMPRYQRLVKLHQEKRPIFSRYQLEEQIENLYRRKIQLKSGGSLVIDPAEALVAIDVNSGRSTHERSMEETAYKTNLEAAEEIARQLRLRDLGGLIIIDFIDMRDRKHIAEVEKALKNAFKNDKAKIDLGRISKFGLVEMSRQRIRSSLFEGSYNTCPRCGGIGKVKSVESQAVIVFRKLYAATSAGDVAEVSGVLPPQVAVYLLNKKRQELARIEAERNVAIHLTEREDITLDTMTLNFLKREVSEEKPAPVQAGAIRPPLEPIEDEPEELGGPDAELDDATEPALVGADDEEGIDNGAGETLPSAPLQAAAQGPPSRRGRRRRRPRGRRRRRPENQGPGVLTQSPASVSTEILDPPGMTPEAEPDPYPDDASSLTG